MAQPQPEAKSNYFPFLLVLVAAAFSWYQQQADRNNPKPQRRQFVSEGGLTVVDPFTFNTTLLNILNDAPLWDKCSQGVKNQGGFFWMDKDDAPGTVWEELAAQIWSESEYLSQAAGFEYWCNVLTPDIPLVWHQDKDEQLAKQGEMVHPIMGAVWYGFPHVFEGGDLQVLTTMEHYENDVAELEAVEADYNRLVYLNVTHWHRVSPVTAGARVTFAVNIWKERPNGVHKVTSTNGAGTEEALKETAT